MEINNADVWESAKALKVAGGGGKKGRRWRVGVGVGVSRWGRLGLAWAAWSFKQQLILLFLPHQLSSCARPVVVTCSCSPTL